MKTTVCLIIALLATFILSGSCDTRTFGSNGIDSSYYDYNYESLGYKFFEPKNRLMLHYDLEEISALSYYKPGILATVQDESGRLFFIDTKEGKIVNTIRFDTSGDYEGVEIVGNTAYVVESNGDIFKFPIDSEKKPKVKKENTVFTSANDVEGMGFHNGKLLLVCKASGDIKGNKVKGKAVYKVDPKDLEVKKKEWLNITEKEIEDFIKNRRFFNKIREFDPSGIAIHPITKDIYIISADKLVVIFDEQKELKEVVKLNGSTYRQAEGICFAPDGTMYISNEGDGSRGRVFELPYSPKAE